MAPVASAITRVLVTGFGPFQGVPVNPSWAIASRLPAALPNDIELFVHPAEVRVAYHPTADLVPQLIRDVQPDIALHIGVAEGRRYFAVEQTSRKNVYGGQDIDGKIWTAAEGQVAWGNSPETLSTDLDLPAVVEEWTNLTSSFKWPPLISGRASGSFLEPNEPVSVALKEDVLSPLDEFIVMDDEVRWSDAVGSYLCAFIYYADMVEMGNNGPARRKDVSFMHVPLLRSEEEIQIGVDVTTALIQSLVKTWREQNAVA